jgi:hypothetical protein
VIAGVGGASLVIGLLLSATRAPNVAVRERASSPSVDRDGAAVATDVRSAQLTADRQVRFIDSNDGTIRQAAVEATSGSALGTATIVVGDGELHWALSGSSLVVRDDEDSLRWVTIGIDDGSIALLDRAVIAPTLNPAGTRIAYLFTHADPTTNTVSLADRDGQKWTAVFDVPTRYRQLWWGPTETYLIGLNDTVQPPRYDRIALSSKKVEPLAEGTGELRWSPDGDRAVVDRGSGLGVTIVELESKTATTIDTAATVDQLTWESASSLVGFAGTNLIRLDLVKREQQTLRHLPEISASAVVLGMANHRLVYLQDTTIRTLPLD